MKKGSLAERWIKRLAPDADDLHREAYFTAFEEVLEGTVREPLHPSEEALKFDEREGSRIASLLAMLRIAKERGLPLPDPDFKSDLPLRRLIAAVDAGSPLRSFLQSLGALKGYELELDIDRPLWEEAALFVQSLLDNMRALVEQSSDPRRYSHEQALLRSPDRILAILFCCVNRCDLIKDLHFPYDSEMKAYALIYRTRLRDFGGIKD